MNVNIPRNSAQPLLDFLCVGLRVLGVSVVNPRWPGLRWSRWATLGLAFALLAGCEPATEATTARSKTQVVRIATVVPERATIRRTTREPGQVEAFERTDIHAKIAGYIRELNVDIGDRIESGQLLAELDVPEVEADVLRKRAHLEQDQAEQRKAEALVEVAETAVATAEARIVEVRASVRRTEAEVVRWQSEFQRIEQLVREQAITSSLRDETRSKLEAARAAQEEAEAQVQVAEAARAQARAESGKARTDVAVAKAHVRFAEADIRHSEALAGYTRIVAPYDGIVTHRHVDTGHLTDTNGAQDPLLTVARTDRVRVSIGVPEADAPYVDPGDPAEIRLQALGDRMFEGTVTRISYALDRETRTLRAEIDLENPEGVLRPGLYVYVTIIAEEHEDVLTLPRAAVARDEGESYCVVVANGRAERRPIEVGLSDRERVEIVSGLEGQEAVVAANPGSLTEGQAVQVDQPEGKES
ncbi:efflux RND transporter periplasmic adaptor subunit [soil metagenome]